MSDKFIGKWIPDKSYGDLEGFDAFNKAMDTPKELVEKFKDAKMTIDTKKDGDTWTNVFSVGNKELKTYQFCQNEDKEFEGIDGKMYKYCCHMDDTDGAWVDVAQPLDKTKKSTTTRKTLCEKDGKCVMTAVTTINDLEPKVSITNTFTRV